LNSLRIINALDKVFQSEIQTLETVRLELNESYTQAIRLLSECEGSVIVTGAGKSGIIGNKIASTMTSTGTPAIFLNAGDLMHGDLGRIQSDDVVLAISKSGETDELLASIPHIREIGVTVISLTANPESTLGRLSNVVLYTPVDAEACPLGLAPTSSTTAALVVGDALAMVLMEIKGFKQDDFARFHPGGQLGKRLLFTIRDVMRTDDRNPIVKPDSSIRDVLIEITSKQTGAVSVVDSDYQLLGLITDFDIRNVLTDNIELSSVSAAEIMNDSPTFIFSDEKALDAMVLMENRMKPFIVLPVLDRLTESVVGMLHIHDLLAQGL